MAAKRQVSILELFIDAILKTYSQRMNLQEKYKQLFAKRNADYFSGDHDD